MSLAPFTAKAYSGFVSRTDTTEGVLAFGCALSVLNTLAGLLFIYLT